MPNIGSPEHTYPTLYTTPDLTANVLLDIIVEYVKAQDHLGNCAIKDLQQAHLSYEKAEQAMRDASGIEYQS